MTTSSQRESNPKLLQTVEDAIRRLILPELSSTRKEEQRRSRGREVEQRAMQASDEDFSDVYDEIPRPKRVPSMTEPVLPRGVRYRMGPVRVASQDTQRRNEHLSGSSPVTERGSRKEVRYHAEPGQADSRDRQRRRRPRPTVNVATSPSTPNGPRKSKNGDGSFIVQSSKRTRDIDRATASNTSTKPTTEYTLAFSVPRGTDHLANEIDTSKQPQARWPAEVPTVPLGRPLPSLPSASDVPNFTPPARLPVHSANGETRQRSDCDDNTVPTYGIRDGFWEKSSAQDDRFETPLQEASFFGQQSEVHALIDTGADVNAGGGVIGNALHCAAFGGHVHTVLALLRAGADVNAQSGDFCTALQAAIAGNSDEALVGLCVLMLLAAGADVNIVGGEYGTALQAAAALGIEDCVALLLKNKASVNTRGGMFGTAIAAARSGVEREKVIEMLLDAGAEEIGWEESVWRETG